MKLIVGLGNPEAKYHRTRHNIGFAVLDAFAAHQGVSFREKTKFHAYTAETALGDEKVLLVKPTTFYNLSGEAVRAATEFYGVAPEDVLVVHDELALPFGRIRTRLGGSAAGNNGIKSIIQHVGDDTARLRLGIDNELRGRGADASFVLSRFSADEEQDLADAVIPAAIHYIERFIEGRHEITSQSIR